MKLNSRVFALACILYTFFCSSTILLLSNGISMSDINCLKSIKNSLEDPFDRLTWTFDDDFLSDFHLCSLSGVTCSLDDLNYIFKVNRIELRDMSLKGPFPRGVELCTNLNILDLSGNNLFGPIPSQLCRNLRTSLLSLILSNNSLSGEIPPSLADCVYLEELALDKNSLTGRIPRQLGELVMIKKFNVSMNMLSGPVPNFAYANLTRESYANNSNLCGGPLKPCGGYPWSTFKNGFVVGYAFSVVSFVTVFISYCLPWVDVKRRKKITLATVIMLMIEGKNKLSRPKHDVINGPSSY